MKINIIDVIKQVYGGSLRVLPNINLYCEVGSSDHFIVWYRYDNGSQGKSNIDSIAKAIDDIESILEHPQLVEYRFESPRLRIHVNREEGICNLSTPQFHINEYGEVLVPEYVVTVIGKSYSVRKHTESGLTKIIDYSLVSISEYEFEEEDCKLYAKSKYGRFTLYKDIGLKCRELLRRAKIKNSTSDMEELVNIIENATKNISESEEWCNMNKWYGDESTELPIISIPTSRVLVKVNGYVNNDLKTIKNVGQMFHKIYKSTSIPISVEIFYDTSMIIVEREQLLIRDWRSEVIYHIGKGLRDTEKDAPPSIQCGNRLIRIYDQKKAYINIEDYETGVNLVVNLQRNSIIILSNEPKVLRGLSTEYLMPIHRVVAYKYPITPVFEDTINTLYRLVQERGE